MSALLQLGKATLEVGFNSVRALAAGNASHVIKKGTEAFKESRKATGEPSPIGELIVEHEVDHKDMTFLGYHAGSNDKLADQIAKGEMDDKGTDLYFGTKDVAAHFGGFDKNAVILYILGNKDSVVSTNGFQQTYVSGANFGRVMISEAYKISPVWVRYASSVHNQTPSMQRALLAVRATADAMKANLEN